jgi:hypothetical protein
MSRHRMTDWSFADVQASVAAPHGFSVAQLTDLGFPAADYTDSDGGSFWMDKTMMGWLSTALPELRKGSPR